ncbi:MAG: serine/threonine-protein kinase [Prosthecobacter sp.]
MDSCPICHTAFDATKVPGGLCPRCLMTGGVEDADDSPARQAASNWTPPTVAELQGLLHGYEVIEMIGRGGMGAVYKARQPTLDRVVAVKVLPVLQDDLGVGFVERFRNEARMMARMNHPGIVHVYDFGELKGGMCFFVMEFVQGTDVAQMVKTNGRLSPEHAASITADVCAALHYAHEAGIVHRDIKPANILVSEQGQVKVADFGLAKSQDPDAGGVTGSGLTLGTPDYAAPELLISGMLVDHRADLYAVGVMLYNMLTGDIPRGVFNPVSRKVNAHGSFDDIIRKAMNADREKRYQTAVAMKTDVQRASQPRMAASLRGLGYVAAALALLAIGFWMRPLLMPEAPARVSSSVPLASPEGIVADVCSKGGKVVVKRGDALLQISDAAGLPAPPHEIEEILFNGITDPAQHITDDELARWLPRLPGLRRFIVEDSPALLQGITSRGLDHFKGLLQLQSLSLDHLPLADTQLTLLDGLPGLLHLSLAHTGIDGTGFAPNSLVRLNVLGCPITPEGWEAIQQLGRLKYLKTSPDYAPELKRDAKGFIEPATLAKHFGRPLPP